MIRQTGMALGVAALVAIIGTPGSPLERLVAFRHAWWAMAAVVAVGLIPALLLRRPGARAAIASQLAANPQPSWTWHGAGTRLTLSSCRTRRM